MKNIKVKAMEVSNSKFDNFRKCLPDYLIFYENWLIETVISLLLFKKIKKKLSSQANISKTTALELLPIKRGGN